MFMRRLFLMTAIVAPASPALATPRTGTVTIAARHSGKCLEIATRKHRVTKQTTCDADVEHWTLTQSGNGYRIKSESKNRCLDSARKAGNAVGAYCDQTSSQVWTVRKVSGPGNEGWYQIFNDGTSCLDVAKRHRTELSNVITYPCDLAKLNQHWQIEPISTRRAHHAEWGEVIKLGVIPVSAAHVDGKLMFWSAPRRTRANFRSCACRPSHMRSIPTRGGCASPPRARAEIATSSKSRASTRA